MFAALLQIADALHHSFSKQNVKKCPVLQPPYCKPASQAVLLFLSPDNLILIAFGRVLGPL